MVKWVCRHCFNKNVISVTSCSSCGRSNDGTWTCFKCSFGYNSLHNSVCDQCCEPYEELTQRSDSCTLRRFVNGSVAPTPSPQLPQSNVPSSSIHASRPQRMVVDASHARPAPGQWACPQCTLHNDLSRIVCEVCQYKRSIDEVDRVRHVAAQPTRRCDFCSQPMGVNDPRRTCETCERNERTQRQELLQQRSTSHIEMQQQQKTEIDAKLLYDNIVSMCTKMGEKFVDDSFLPSPKSLYFNPNSMEARSSKVTWQRPSVISNKKWSVCDSPSSDDIQQGVLGNCWLMSALAVIADRRELIDKIILYKQCSPHGVYQVRLCKEGQWYIVTIDDNLPCDAAGHLVYSKAAGQQLWVPLIEKAAAKLFGCYEALSTGYCIEGLSLLTGAPCESLVLQPSNDHYQCQLLPVEEDVDYDVIWAKLLSAKDANFLFSASCGGGTMQPNESQYQAVGLSARHAYSILDIVDIIDKNGTSHRLLKLMNPWSSRYNCWNGAWSPRSSSWDVIDAALRKNLSPANGYYSRGVFWMEFSDMIKYFYCIDICRLRPSYHERRIRCKLPQPQRIGDDRKINHTIVIQVTDTTEAEFVLYQEKSRHEDSLKKDIFFVVLEGDATTVNAGQHFGRVVAYAKRTLNFSTTCYAVLQPGVYTVVWFSFWNWGPQPCLDEVQGTMAIFTTRKISAREISFGPNFIPDVLMHFVVSKGICQPQSSNAFYLTGKWVGMFLVVENSSHTSLVVISDCNNSTNMQCTRSPLDNLVVKDSIPPRYRQVVTVLTQVDAYSPYTFHHNMEYSHSLLPTHDHQPPLILALHEPRPIPYR